MNRLRVRRTRLRAGLALFGTFLLAAVSTGDGAAPEEPLLPFSTYLGGSVVDEGRAVAIGPDGVVWVAVDVSSDEFPGAPRTSPSAKYVTDVVVLRIDPATRAVLSTIRLGGSDQEYVAGLAVDAAGNAYVAGSTLSPDFPLTGGTLGTPSPWSSGRVNATFVARVLPDGSGFAWVWALGGSGRFQHTNGMCLTADGDPVVVGTTESADLPLASPFDATYAGEYGEGFVARVRADGTGLVFSSFLGGSDTDGAGSVCLAPDGAIVVAGWTSSADFVAPAERILGAPDAPPFYAPYLAEIDADGTSLRRLARVGVGFQYMTAAEDSLVVVGRAWAGSALPFQPDDPATKDAYFVLRLDAPTWTPIGGRFLGRSLEDLHVSDVAVGADGTLWIAGSTGTGAPPVPGAVRPRTFGDDAYVAAFAPADFTQVFGTFLGGDGRDFGDAVAVAPDGSAWVVGTTGSTNLPLSRPVQSSYRAAEEYYGSNAFVAQFLSGDPASRPAAVLASAAAPVNGHAIRVSWTAADDAATAFGIDRTEVRDEGILLGWSRVALVPGEAREWLDTGLRSDRRYQYSVQAVNASGGSPASPPLETATPPTLDFTILEGLIHDRWSRRTGTVRLRGTLARRDGAGDTLDLPKDGFRLVGGDHDWGHTVIAVASGDRRWRVRRDGTVRWQRRGARIDFAPATGEFDLRVVREFGNSLETLSDPEVWGPATWRLLVGEDAGSTVPVWRAIRAAPDHRRTPWHGRVGARTP